jgi:hypothetical protein
MFEIHNQKNENGSEFCEICAAKLITLTAVKIILKFQTEIESDSSFRCPVWTTSSGKTL